MPVGRSLGDDGRPAAATLRPGGVAVAADVAGGRQGTSRGFSQEPPARAGLSAGAPSLPGCSLRASGAPGSLGRLLPAGASPMDARGLFRSVSPPASVPAHPSTGQHFRRRPAARAVSGPSAPSDQSDWALAAKALGRVGVQGAQRGGGETNGGGRGAGGSCPSRQLVKGGGGSKTSRFFKDR